MENEFYLQQQNPTWNSTTCDLNPYFSNTSNWDSSFQSTLTSVHPQQQAPLISADPGFVEKAARFSIFGSCQGLKPPGSEFGEIPDEKKMNDFSPENGEESSVSEPVKSVPLNPRKRKSNPKGKNEIKINQIERDADAKRTKSEESNGTEKSGRNSNGKSKDDSKNNAEPFKDYIHVRARRGQATDSHSLAERVRREKISQRMKFLQDLVPGCNKVTGKAVMLDEIINYVQSLQLQVELLSMKLSSVNPMTDINVEALLSKDLHQARSLLSQSMFALESSPGSSAFSYGYPSQSTLLKKNAHSEVSESSFSMSPLNTQGPNHVVQLPPSIDEFDQSASRVSMWMDELYNVVQMGYGQNELQNFQALLATDMKMEQ